MVYLYAAMGVVMMTGIMAVLEMGLSLTGQSLLLKPIEGSVQESDGVLCLANTGARARHCGSLSEVPW